MARLLGPSLTSRSRQETGRFGATRGLAVLGGMPYTEAVMGGSRPASCGVRTMPPVSRRDLLRRAGLGLGGLALTTLLAEEGRLCADDGGTIDPRTLNGKAKSVILLFMGGGPSQVDTFDPKPELTKWHGKDVPPSIAKDIPRVARAPLTNLFASPYRFTPRGRCGLPVSELFPEIGACVDDLCI